MRDTTHGHAVDLGGNAAKHSGEFTAAPLASCLPIRANSLVAGTTHKGRVLRGIVAVPKPAVKVGTIVLLADEDGDLVQARADAVCMCALRNRAACVL